MSRRATSLRLFPSILLAVPLVFATPETEAASWSPDGKRIAYSYIGGPESIYLVNPDGLGYTPLVVREQRDFQPEWAPDGSHLVFTSVVDGAHILMKVNRDGSGLEAISKPEEAAADPDYSPDGRRLVYFTAKPRPRDLWVRDVSTGEAKALTSTPDFDEYSPRWAPDGHHVAFVGKEGGEGSKGDIWILDTESGERRNATSTAGVDEFHPSWSHDGSRLVYIRNIDGKFSVGLREVSTGNEKVVADGNGYAVLSPHFSIDDGSVTFTRTDFAEKGEGMPAIVRVTLADGKETRIIKGLYLSQMEPKSRTSD